MKTEIGARALVTGTLKPSWIFQVLPNSPGKRLHFCSFCPKVDITHLSFPLTNRDTRLWPFLCKTWHQFQQNSEAPLEPEALTPQPRIVQWHSSQLTCSTSTGEITQNQLNVRTSRSQPTAADTPTSSCNKVRESIQKSWAPSSIHPVPSSSQVPVRNSNKGTNDKWGTSEYSQMKSTCGQPLYDSNSNKHPQM